MSGIRISEFKKPRTIIVDQAKVDSAYGPKSSILLESLATSWSKNGFTIEVKGLSRDSLLNGMFVTIPLQIRWKAQGGVNEVVSEFFDRDDPYGYAANFEGGAGKENLFSGFKTDCRSYDGVCIRPNAFKCIRNATLSINGSSFSTRTDAYYTALCKLFCDGRQEDITGAAYETYPYSNCGDARQALVQKGWYERCRNLNTMGKIVKIVYDVADGKHFNDIVMQYDVKFPLWFGPFTHLGFPGLSGFDGQSVASIPYVSDLVLECTFTDDVLMDAFAGPDTAVENSLATNSPTFTPKAVSAGTDWMPNTYAMWNAAIPADILSDATKFVGILQPKLCYMFSEPDPDKMTIAPIYTLPSYRFITYEDRKPLAKGASFAARSETVNISFPYIRLSNISALYIACAEGARVDISTNAIAARSSRYQNNTYKTQRLGLACANRTCPIKWDTVRVSMSTSSSVLTNFVQNTITEQRQYELFKKYSNDAMALTFEQWQESSQMLLFSAEELCGIGAFANSFQALTLSVSFDVYRDATDTKLTACQFTATSDQAINTLHPGAPHIDPSSARKGNDKGCAIVGRLICIEPELVSISEGAVSVEQVKLSQAEIHNQLMGGAPEVEDANQLDQLAR